MGRSLALLALLAAPSALAWLSISQARYGTSLDDLRATTYGTSTRNADMSLGWIWSAPRTRTDPRGLGQSITWAWDPALCDKLLPAFKSDAFGIPMLDCQSVRTVRRPLFGACTQRLNKGSPAPRVRFFSCAAVTSHRR